MRLAAARNRTPIERFLYRSRETEFFVRANALLFEANLMISEKPLEAFKVDDKEQRFSHAQIL